MNEDFKLVGGPQDGGMVKDTSSKGNPLPQTIYLNGIVHSDTYCTWSRTYSNRFKYCYVLDGSKFKYKGNGA